VSLVLQQSVRSLFSANNRIGRNAGLDERHAATQRRPAITLNRLYIVIFTLIVFAILSSS